MEPRGPTRKAERLEVGSECVVQHSPGSTAGQGAREKASRPRTGPCCPLAKREGDGNVETGSRALPSSPSWDPEKKETALMKFWVPLARGPVAEQNKNSPPGPPPGEGVVLSPSPEEQDPEAPGRRPRDAAYPGTSQAWQGRRRAAPLSCGQLHAAAIVKAAEGRAGAEVEAAGGRLRR